MVRDPTCPAGTLIPRRRAPRCCNCGRVLWTAVYPGYGWPSHNEKKERLGYVPMYRGKGRTRACWNQNLCRKRVKALASELEG